MTLIMVLREALAMAFTVGILLASLVSTSLGCLLGNANTDTGHALVGVSYASFTTANYPECLTECVRSSGCISLNFVLTNGTCELNSATKDMHPDLFVRRENSIYTTKKDYHRELTEPRISATQKSTTRTTTTQAPTTQTTQSPTTQTTQSPTTQTTQPPTTQTTHPPTTQTTQSPTTQTTQSPTTQTTTAQTTTTDTPTTASIPKSCLEILRSGNSVGDGVYSIDPTRTGIPIQAYCDMTTDGGGWTIIKRTIFQTATPPQNLRIRTFEVISEFNANDKNIYPTSAALLDIKNKMGFHQIHFYCHKQSVGRVLSIRTRNDTVGHQVLRYYTDDDFALTNFVAACDSFDRLPEDTSILGQNCAQWNKNTGTWGKTSGSSRTLSTTFYIKDANTYGCTVNPPKVEYCACDDPQLAPLSYNPQDRWQISVR